MWKPATCFSNIAYPEVSAGTQIYYSKRLSLWLWKLPSSFPANPNKWVMAAAFPMLPRWNGTAMVTNYSKGQYGGYPVYYDAIEHLYFWYSAAWYASAIVGGSVSEYALDDNPSVYLGDAWYSGGNFTDSLAWYGRGTNYGSGKNVSWATFVGWIWTSGGTAPYGMYSGSGGATGRKYVGSLNLSDDLGNTYLQAAPSNALTVLDDSSTYYSKLASDKTEDRGDISWSSTLGKWIIGTYSTAAGTGYWEGSATLPLSSLDSSVTFTRVWNADPEQEDPTPGNITVSFSSWTASASWIKDGLFLEAGVTLP